MVFFTEHDDSLMKYDLPATVLLTWFLLPIDRNVATLFARAVL